MWLEIPGHTQPTVVVVVATFLWWILTSAKYRISLLEILMTEQFCNLIGRDHFTIELVSQNFSRYMVSTRKKKTVMFFILTSLKNFFNLLCSFNKNMNFLWKMGLPLLSSYGFLTSCRISKKTGEQIPRKKCYGPTNGQTDIWWMIGWTGGWIEGSEFM